jgi:hypothetical protein
VQFTDPSSNQLVLADIDGLTGAQAWTQNVYTDFNIIPASEIFKNYAIRGDGAIFDSFNDTTAPYSVVMRDGNTGQTRLNLPIQQSTFNDVGCGSVLENGPISPPFVDTDGATNFLYTVYQATRPVCGVYQNATVASTLWQMKIGPDNSITSLPITSAPSFIDPSQAIPDGQGGLLAVWGLTSFVYSGVNQGLYVAHVSSNNAVISTLRLDQAVPGFSGVYQMVLGENGTAFATDGATVVSFDINSAQINWIYASPSQTTVSIIASASGNSLVAKTTAQNGTDTVVRLDALGQPSSDAWNGTGLQYFFGDLWSGQAGVPSVEMFSAASIPWSSSPWNMPDPRGGWAATPPITVRVARVQNVDLEAQLSDSDISNRVQQAVNFWQSSSNIALNWDGVLPIPRVPGCATDQPLCSAGNLYDITEVADNGTTFAELSRRFKQPKGLQLIFCYSVAGSTSQGITVAVQDSFGNTIDYNVSAIAKAAQALATAHEIGHIFQLEHTLNPLNIMCGNSLLCPQTPSNGITDDQIRNARRFAITLSEAAKQ